MGEREVVTVHEAAIELGVSHVSVWRYIDKGRLPARRVGPIYLIDQSDLDAFKAIKRPKGRPRKSTG